MVLVKSKSDTYRVAVTLLDILFSVLSRRYVIYSGIRDDGKRKFNMPRISKRVHANPLNFENQRERFSVFSRLTRIMFCTGTQALRFVHAFWRQIGFLAWIKIRILKILQKPFTLNLVFRAKSVNSPQISRHMRIRVRDKDNKNRIAFWKNGAADEIHFHHQHQKV